MLKQAIATLRAYWTMIKSLQTGLLVISGIAGYVSGCCLAWKFGSLASLIGSLTLAISGSTILNMVIDRDIDAQMPRTAKRPLPSSQVSASQATWVGIVISLAGVAWAYMLSLRYGILVAIGLFLDVIVYTLWLKRRTPFAILIGGLSGGVPALAGRVLAVGQIDLVGIMLCLAILFWIPTHIMTFSIKYQADYQAAHVPTFPSMYGVTMTRRTITFFSILAAVLMIGVGMQIGIAGFALSLMFALGIALILISVIALVSSSPKLNYGLFKFASIYMLGSLLIIINQGL